MSKLEQYFNRQSAVLEAQYERSEEINHNLTAGECREILVEQFLSELYPKTFLFGNGEIIDSSGGVSKQTDIVAYDDRLPALEYGGSKHYFSEGVLAHIEVKTDISGELDNALKNVESVKDLTRDVDSILRVGRPSSEIFSCIFAFQGPEHLNLVQEVREYYYENINGEEYRKSTPIVDCICVLGEYVIFRDERGSIGFNTLNPLLQFFIILTNAMNSNLMVRPDLRRYTDTNSHFMK